MFKLNESQKKFVELALKVFNKDTLTRVDIKTLVKDHGQSWPSWLIRNFRVDRGSYKLPTSDSDIPTNPDSEPKVKVLSDNSETKKEAAYIVSSLVDNVVPDKDDTFIPFGNHTDIRNIVKSKRFYPVFVTGLSGNGKTFSILQACAESKRECIRVNVTIETDEDDLIGGYRLKDGSTVWQNGPVIEAMERGAILLLDEVDLASNKIMCLQPVLEGSGIFIKKINKYITPKEGFNVIATANTKGQGSEDGKFIGTNVLNEAFLERFPVTFEQKYPSAAIEEKIVNKILEIAGKSDPDFTKKLITWAEVIRKTFFDGGIDEIVSTRRLVHIATAFTIFSSKMKAIEVCTNRFDDDTKSSFVDLYTKVDSGATAESILQEQQQSEVEGDSTSESDDSEEDSDATSAV